MNRPVILIGNGCRGNLVLLDQLCTAGIPVLTTWQAIDLVSEDCPTFCGRPGVIGQRAANIIVQKASALYVFGAKLDSETVGWNLDNFAPLAQKFIYDFDEAELNKLPDRDDWHKRHADLPDIVFGVHIECNLNWLFWCQELYKRFRPELEGDPNSRPVDPYYFVRVLSDVLKEGDIIVPGSSGMQSCAMMQAFKVKSGQRILLCNTIGAMGMEPMAIGAAIASGKPVTVVTGDGGFSLNVQELEVVDREDLPIKYFVFSNSGYASVVSMQDSRFGRRVGADPGSGFTLPELWRIADVYDLPYHLIRSSMACSDIDGILEIPGPALIEVKMSIDFRYACKMGSRLQDNKFTLNNLEDMLPSIPDLPELMKWGIDD